MNQRSGELLDHFGRPLRDLRISVMDRCNFRCPYCMPEDAPEPDLNFLESPTRLNFSEIIRLTRIFAALGVHKLRITGGEPLLRKNLDELVAGLTALPGINDVALTTNASLLDRHALALKQAGLGRVTVSLDSINPEVFQQMTGHRGSVEQVLAGIDAAQAAGLTPIKINVVVQRGANDHTLLELLEHFRGTKIIVRLIEYMDVGNLNHWKPENTVNSIALVEMISQKWPLKPLDENYHGEVAQRWAYVDGKGEIGLISSVSEPFCGSCTRARLSSDGVLYNCLFATQGLDLRSPMREGISDEDLAEMITESWHMRRDRYSEVRSEASVARSNKVEMYYIGG
ncbi:MAG: GTP 3',8-cyclase MoaA [Xanthomonadales bacterium]|nr:GTP 3',8-cyclase MoaA [Xanthomonadales bacterium]